MSCLLAGITTTQAQKILESQIQQSDSIASVFGSQKPLTSSDSSFIENHISDKDILDQIEFTDTHIILDGLPIRREPLSYEEVNHIQWLILGSTVFWDGETWSLYFTKEGISLVKSHMQAINPFLDTDDDWLKELFTWDHFIFVRKNLNTPPGFSLHWTVAKYYSLHPVK